LWSSSGFATTTGIIGISGSCGEWVGPNDDVKHVDTGIKPETIAWFRKELKRKKRSYSLEGFFDDELDRCVYVKRPWSFDRYHVPDLFKDMNWDKALRHNQGDAFFATHLEGVDLPATPPGEASAPLFDSLFPRVK
jgi:hypothetical protein